MTYMTPQVEPSSRSVTGIGRVLIAVYGVLAVAAVGRSFVQIVAKFNDAPFAYVLSAVAAIVYVVATVALLRSGKGWHRVAVLTIGFELVGVLVVGTLSISDPQLFAHDTVWSVYGRGYVFVPLVLPVLGLWWLRTGGGMSQMRPQKVTKKSHGAVEELYRKNRG